MLLEFKFKFTNLLGNARRGLQKKNSTTLEPKIFLSIIADNKHELPLVRVMFVQKYIPLYPNRIFARGQFSFSLRAKIAAHHSQEYT